MPPAAHHLVIQPPPQPQQGQPPPRPAPPPTQIAPGAIPWAQLAVDALTTLKYELTAALAAYRQRVEAATRLLDAAHALEQETAGPLRQAAYAAFARYMQLAADASSAIVEPAVQAYDREMEAASSDYNAAIADAEKNYQRVVADANLAKKYGNL